MINLVPLKKLKLPPKIIALLRLLAQFKLERGRPFNPKDSYSREVIQSVIDRSY